jgi:enoyl-[acyl-carrier protein] reductase III
MSILVTGGTKGIGLAIAKAFAQPGNHVFLNYLADDAAAAQAAHAIVGAGGTPHLVKADVGTPRGGDGDRGGGARGHPAP